MTAKKAPLFATTWCSNAADSESAGREIRNLVLGASGRNSRNLFSAYRGLAKAGEIEFSGLVILGQDRGGSRAKKHSFGFESDRR